MVGRVDEIRLLTNTIRQVRSTRGVILVGAAGVGKTRLAQEAFEQARSIGPAARWVTATASARALPLGAFAMVLPSIGSDPLRVLDQAVSALLAEAEPRTVLIVVDDAHPLDDVSAMLVHRLVLGGLATILIRVRSGEPVPDAVTALWKDGYLDRVSVHPLSPAETGQMLETMLGGPVDSASIQEMWRLADGNALYIRELFSGVRTAGWWTRRAGPGIGPANWP